MVPIATENMGAIAPLFAGWEETLIWSCLQGCMGRAWADREEEPRAAQIQNGDFLFFAGDPAAPGAGELARHIPQGFAGDGPLAIPQTPGWEALLRRVWGDRAQPITRYAIKKEPGVFHRASLEAFAALPQGFSLRPIDGELYRLARQEAWSRDLVSQFPTPQDYAARGLGVAALEGGRLAAGASSYTVYREGIEIQIDTREEYRRRGLALACGAALILRCLDQGLYPSWDAANQASVALAEKLGYHFSHAYSCLSLSGPFPG